MIRGDDYRRGDAIVHRSPMRTPGLERLIVVTPSGESAKILSHAIDTGRTMLQVAIFPSGAATVTRAIALVRASIACKHVGTLVSPAGDMTYPVWTTISKLRPTYAMFIGRLDANGDPRGKPTVLDDPFDIDGLEYALSMLRAADDDQEQAR